MDTWHNVGQAFKLWIRLDKRDLVVESKKGEKIENSKLLFSIYGVPSVGIRRAKNESSSSRRGLREGTKKKGFQRRSKGKGFGKSNFWD